MRDTVSIRARAELMSLGGVILLSMIFSFLVLLIISYNSPYHSLWLRWILTMVLVATLVYFLEGLTEELRFDGETVRFRAWFKPAPAVDLMKVEKIFLVHEGLNVEHGIETMLFQLSDGSRIRFGLGPLWHQHHLLTFVRELEGLAGKTLLIEKL